MFILQGFSLSDRKKKINNSLVKLSLWLSFIHRRWSSQSVSVSDQAVLQFLPGPAYHLHPVFDLNRAQSLALVRRQLWMPDIHDEDEAVAIGILPHLMLKRVVEDEDLTFLPLPVRQKMKKNEKQMIL